ncbi:MAG: PEGA domain-containing protein [Spirochaetaceae bacterium]|nr:PEGA domain-containing protein [Spirochaetaceae bacterium]
MKKLLFVAMIALLALPGAVFAQRTATQAATPASYQLTIQVNVKGASIFIDGGQIKGNVATVTAGNHSVMVQAPGYLDFSTTVSVNGNMTLPVTMQAATFQLSVNASNVKGAQVLLNGKAAGNTPFNTQLPPGTYTVTVQAPGFLGYNESFTMSGAKSINVTLQPATFQLSVNANVKGAQVLLNGGMAGNAPFNTQLSPGTYTVTVQAPGFNSYSESFTLTGPKVISVTLQPAMGTVTIALPAASVNTDMKGGHWSQIQVYVDGAIQKGQIIQLPPGRHLIRVTSGGLQVEGFYDIQAGVSYTIEPFMGLNLRQ